MLKVSGKRSNGVALLSLLLLICLTFDLFTRVMGSGLNIQRSSNSRINPQHSHRAEIAKALVHIEKKKRKEISRAQDDSCTYPVKDIDSTNTPWHLGHGMFAELDALLNEMESELSQQT
jgi:glucose-6-phosphate-specific signal transduction histidine kinase